jgi:glutathione S-transferase
MPQAILYSFRRCPYAMRARMALNVSGLDYEHREVTLRDKPQTMLEASPKGTVPVFIKTDGEVIDESLAVMKFALTQNDPENWMCDKSEKTEQFISQMDNKFKFHLDRYKYASRYNDDAKRGDVDLVHRAKAVEILQVWEDALSHNTYLLGDTPSLADIATFPFIRQFAATDREWWDCRPLPHIADWLDSFLSSDRFKTIMKKHPLWSPDK